MAYISKEDVAAIRKELKDKFPGWKFSVKKGVGSLSVDVAILKGKPKFEGKDYAQVNQYWINDHWKDAEDAAALNTINEIMHNAPGRAGGKVFFDDSDAMTDYFSTAFYTHLSIGQWDEKYQVVDAK